MSLAIPDVCVIGAGAAGLSFTAAARAVGLSVVLIEKGAMGGECLNSGCVPSKALIAAARHAHLIRTASAFGIGIGEMHIDRERLKAHIDGVIGAIAPHDSAERFERLGAEVIRAEARFTGPDRVEAGGRTIRARRFILATGSRPVIPPIPGLEAVPFLTNESVFDLAALPRHLLVIGAGPIGLELAQSFARLGAHVTVLDAGRPLAQDDPDHTALVLDALGKEGVRIIAPARIAQAGYESGKILLEAEHKGERLRLEGDQLLIAAGRRPALEELGLDAAGIRRDNHGLLLDKALRTSNRRVFAIGDVSGAYRFTHWASYQAGLVLRTILTRWPHVQDRRLIAWATYTDPEIAHVGLSAAAARARHGEGLVVQTLSFAENDRLQAERATQGQLKIVTDRRGRVLGASIVGPHAGEMAALAALALAARLKLGAFSAMIVPYPTQAELFKRAAFGFYSHLAKRSLSQGLLAALRWFSRLGR